MLMDNILPYGLSILASQINLRMDVLEMRQIEARPIQYGVGLAAISHNPKRPVIGKVLDQLAAQRVVHRLNINLPHATERTRVHDLGCERSIKRRRLAQ